MSAAKMVADSTQGDDPGMSGTKKRKKMVQKKKVKKKKESVKRSKKKSQQEEEFDDSDLDLDKEVYPIDYYVKDRESLLEQMLHCVRGQSLNRALPDVLKELPLEDLKGRCMEQLEVMSKKRIRRILSGDDPASISSSGTEDETSEEEAQDIEEGELGCEGMDTQVVDSTSYTIETAGSDREVEFDEGSIGHSSPCLSDEEQDGQQQYEDDENANGSDENADMEDDNHFDNEPEDLPGEPEEPEEGEVFDDNSKPGVVNKDICEETEEGKESGDAVMANEQEALVVRECKEAEEVCDNAEKSDVETKDDEKGSEGTGPIDDSESDNRNENVGKYIVSDRIKSDGQSNEVKLNVDCETGADKTENTEEDRKQEDVKDVLKETEGNEDHVITVEPHHVIDEKAANIGTEYGDEEISNGDKILEKEKITKSVGKSMSEEKKVKQPHRIVKPPSQDIAPALTRNQMELLELEMRARAIKAMLKTAK